MGLRALADKVEAVVLVDVLRFTTALEVAASAGAIVGVASWPFDRLERADGVEEADGSGPRGLSLSPGSLAGLARGDRILLPSANGSHISAVAVGAGALVVGACLRNAAAVARWVDHRAGGGAISVVPCGERWPDGSLRPAVEDLLGAGALVSQLAGERSCSPEASAARAAFEAARPEIETALAESVSWRELRLKGLEDDVLWAADVDVSECVPVLGADRAYRAA
jgi:2-phosphosulfolactate phosphatase